jgi:hypothetical protein
MKTTIIRKMVKETRMYFGVARRGHSCKAYESRDYGREDE